MIRTLTSLVVVLLAVSFCVPASSAQTPDGTLYFNNTDDTIRIDGQTVFGTTSTYEAWVYFPEGGSAGGRLFNEWTSFQEDKVLGVGPSQSFGFNHPTSGNVLTVNGEVELDEWHHIAFVHDGPNSVQRLYIDGEVLASQSAAAEIGDGDGFGTIGAIHRDGSMVASFLGILDSVRLSSSARYGEQSFEPPARDMPDDADTVLLYHFREEDFFLEDGKIRVTDLSGESRHGTFATSFLPAGDPAPPGRQGDLDCNGTLSASDALKDLRASVGLPVAQDEPCPNPKEPLTTGLFGDVDCNGSLTASDALKVLRVSVGLTSEQTLPCPVFLEPV